MKKIWKVLLVFLMMFSITVFSYESSIDATSGRLITKSIRKCKGKYYGKHKNHWHYAARSKKNKKFWYPKTTKSLGKKTPKACRK